MFEFEYETIRVRKDLIPDGGKLVEAYETDNQIIIIGDPPPEPEGLSTEEYERWEETAHNCDQMGCSTLSHVLYRFDKGCSWDGQSHAAQERERLALREVLTRLVEIVGSRPSRNYTRKQREDDLQNAWVDAVRLLEPPSAMPEAGAVGEAK